MFRASAHQQTHHHQPTRDDGVLDHLAQLTQSGQIRWRSGKFLARSGLAGHGYNIWQAELLHRMMTLVAWNRGWTLIHELDHGKCWSMSSDKNNEGDLLNCVQKQCASDLTDRERQQDRICSEILALEVRGR